MRRLNSFVMIPLVGLLLSPGLVHAQPERCGTPTAAGSASSGLTNEFGIYRPGTAGVDVRYRDLEFGWDTLFAAKMSDPVRGTLYNWAGMLLLGTGISPIAPSGRGLEVVYDYFRLQGSDWTDDLSQTPLRLGTGADGYSIQDRGHVDLYLTVPNRLDQTPNEPRNYGGQYPSGWNAFGEDLTTGWPADTALPVDEYPPRGASPRPGSDRKLKRSMEHRPPRCSEPSIRKRSVSSPVRLECCASSRPPAQKTGLASAS